MNFIKKKAKNNVKINPKIFKKNSILSVKNNIITNNIKYVINIKFHFF